MPPVGPIPGDPAALEAGARGYGAAAEAWQALGAEVSTVAFGLAGTPDWSGEAAVAFNASAQGLVEAAERGSAAMREGAGALRAYAVALEQAQAAYALASADQAAAEAEQSVARQAVLGVAAGSLLPPPLLSRLDMADAALGAVAGAATAAIEEAQRAAREAAAAFRVVAAQANPAAEQGAPAEGEEGGGLLGWLVRAGELLHEQTVGFARGFGEGVVGLGQGLWMLAKLTPIYYAFDPEGTLDVVRGFGAAIQFAINEPTEFAKAAANWEDIEEGRYAEWLGNLAPDAAIAALTMGGGTAATASTRGLRLVHTLDNAIQRANPLWFRHALMDINHSDPDMTGRNINCSKCAIALDESLAGRPSSALRGIGMKLPDIERYFNSRFSMVSADPIRAMFDIKRQLLAAGPGAKGIVYGHVVGDNGHVFNAMNDNGVVRFLDAQSGTFADFSGGYSWFEFMPTN